MYTFSGRWDDEIILIDKATHVCLIDITSHIRTRTFYRSIYLSTDEKYPVESITIVGANTIETLCCAHGTTRS
jgi:hypothetical protein